ncbi:CPBP family intramembrane glutamic endopeptidase [Curtobacterium herbarum]|uniref:CPBP family intramembrane glutamic endopeptidase n=1 Tax=Curtobacterium herbarum TaxID=150122 RepID=UPI001C8EE47A|nr:type II CAAX endopeptidase family protein [Curtobacterium herbarum]MBY0177392.1 CPBP family intramembrane metalloprotease [Curtobacterium herbarum]
MLQPGAEGARLLCCRPVGCAASPLRNEQSGRHLMLRVDGPVVPEPVAAEVRWKPILIFTVLAWGFGWLVSLPLWIDPMGLASVHALWVLPAMMFTPCAAAAIVVLLQQRVPVRQAVRQLGIVPLRPVGKLLRFSLGGIVLLPLVVIAGIAVAALLHLVRLDLETFSGFAAMLPEEARDLLPIGVLVLVQVISIPIAAPLNGVLAFGEEVGWRGLLLPALRPLGDWPAVLITGVVWGVWHAPIVLLGYNFDRPDLWGVFLMIVGATAVGTFLGWLRIWSGSVWPAVLGHGAFNAAGGLVLLFSSAKYPPDLALAGPLGVGTWIAAAVFATIVIVCSRRSTRRSDGDPVRGCGEG